MLDTFVDGIRLYALEMYIGCPDARDRNVHRLYVYVQKYQKKNSRMNDLHTSIIEWYDLSITDIKWVTLGIQNKQI